MNIVAFRNIPGTFSLSELPYLFLGLVNCQLFRRLACLFDAFRSALYPGAGVSSTVALAVVPRMKSAKGKTTLKFLFGYR